MEQLSQAVQELLALLELVQSQIKTQQEALSDAAVSYKRLQNGIQSLRSN